MFMKYSKANIKYLCLLKNRVYFPVDKNEHIKCRIYKLINIRLFKSYKFLSCELEKIKTTLFTVKYST